VKEVLAPIKGVIPKRIDQLKSITNLNSIISIPHPANENDIKKLWEIE